MQITIKTTEIYQNALTGVKYYIVALIAAAVAITSIVIGAASATGFTFKAPFVFTAGFAAGLIVFLVGSNHCFRILRSCIHSFKKNIRYTRTEIRRTLVCNRCLAALVGLSTDDNWSRLHTDLCRLDICSHWLLHHERTTTANIRFATKRIYFTNAMAPTIQSQRFCPNCGSPVTPDATYCSHCGKQLTS